MMPRGYYTTVHGNSCNDVTGLHTVGTTVGIGATTTHCPSICSRSNTLSSSFDAASLRGAIDKSNSFPCDILLRLFWGQPSMTLPQRARATSFSFLLVILGSQQTPLVHSSVAKEKDPAQNVSQRHTDRQTDTHTFASYYHALKTGRSA